MRKLFGGALGLLCVAVLCAAFVHGSLGTNITTHLYNAGRTGWNNTEGVLTPQNVAGSGFTSICSRTDLDGDIDAQPLLVSGISVAGTLRNVLYVATENNTVYAIDATNCSSILTSVNLGTAVDGSNILAGSCSVVPAGSVSGISATPVIDIASRTLFVIASTWESSAIVYKVHALDLATLADKVTPRVVSATATLSDNVTTYSFNPAVTKIRSALAFGSGNVYAGFTSFCDDQEAVTRGWLLGWNGSTLSPLSQQRLTDRNATGSFFLSTIWMSGGGPAVDASGNLYIVTGNGAAYNPPINFEESAAKLSPDLTSLVDYFTPQNYATLDAADQDFGSGGIMLLPDQAGSSPHTAVAAGKDGNMYFMDRDNMGHFTSGGPDAVLGTYSISRCFCSPVYFVGADGAPRVVSGGGNSPIVWKVLTSGSTTLSSERTLATVNGTIQNHPGLQGGFFTTVSSNGNTNGIIWAVARPETGLLPKLQAFDANTGTQLFTAKVAGAWTNLGRNANIVPVVANGRVYVGSAAGNLFVFGLQ